jgi:SagB-type dehydrogenase family enzyme
MKQNYAFELFHENSKLRSGDIDLYTWINYVNSDPSIRSVISAPVLDYGSTNEILLPGDVDAGEMSYAECAMKRRSGRKFESTTCTLNILSSLLSLSIRENSQYKYDDGVTWSFRPYPSGGGLYPVDIYVAVYNVESVDKGVYFYNPKKHSLTEIENNLSIREIEKAFPTLEDEINQSSFVVFLVSDLNKMAFKYQERAYRFALLECGHIAQNLLLSATNFKMNSFPAGAYMDDVINDFFQLDGVSSNVQYALLFGT